MILLLVSQMSSQAWVVSQEEGLLAAGSDQQVNFSIRFADIESKCNSWLDGYTPADVLLWVVRLLVRETPVPLCLRRASKYPGGTGKGSINWGIKHTQSTLNQAIL